MPESNLLMVSNFFESHRGGLDLVAGRLARELLRLGQKVLWVATDTTPAAQDPELAGRTVSLRALNVTEKRLGIPFPVPHPRAIAAIARCVRRSEVVLLHDTLYPMSVLAFLFARAFRKRIIIIQHVGIVPYRNPALRLLMRLGNRLLARRMLTGADQVAFVSEITARHFAGLPFRSPPRLIFNGVDTAIFHPPAIGTRRLLRGALGLPEKARIALFVGRFVEKKGLHILMRMARQRPDILWVFAGWGHLDPRDWQFANVVVYGDRTGATLAPLYQASDVLVLPSKGEGFPLVIQEALACGLPAVCSAETADADEAVAPFLSAVPLDEATPDETASAFCRAIDELLAGEVDGSGAADERHRFAAERYSWSACARQYLDLIAAVSALRATSEPMGSQEPRASSSLAARP